MEYMLKKSAEKTDQTGLSQVLEREQSYSEALALALIALPLLSQKLTRLI